MRAPRFAAAAAAAALALAGCGDATVDSADVTSTTAPPSTRAGGDGAREDAARRTASSTPAAPEGRAERRITDPAATRAEDAPDRRMPLTPADEDFLAALDEAGIDVTGTEDQLIAAGHAHCGAADADAAIVSAAAGQLVTQGRVEGEAEDVARKIAAAADEAYC
ncbi:DUF732 domain-containing protein [Corynebacterium sphenisci]|uniref:DUF732 domain-containing protein n=1 Tax=Corynebacterium sphenisci TaxID=191493 RepID=UPI0026DF477C|nr:DUF732 domain-containing protein [Corynebacterium sphenisci]MDO5731170.1 DUF732 domain-containing protein [Corynebacterium sphenisci]